MTLTFDLQNLIRSSVRASEYSMSVLSKVFNLFMRYHGNNTDRMNERMGHPKNMSSPTITAGECIISMENSTQVCSYCATSRLEMEQATTS